MKNPGIDDVSEPPKALEMPEPDTPAHRYMRKVIGDLVAFDPRQQKKIEDCSVGRELEMLYRLSQYICPKGLTGFRIIILLLLSSPNNVDVHKLSTRFFCRAILFKLPLACCVSEGPFTNLFLYALATGEVGLKPKKEQTKPTLVKGFTKLLLDCGGRRQEAVEVAFETERTQRRRPR